MEEYKKEFLDMIIPGKSEPSTEWQVLCENNHNLYYSFGDKTKEQIEAYQEDCPFCRMCGTPTRVEPWESDAYSPASIDHQKLWKWLYKNHREYLAPQEIEEIEKQEMCPHNRVEGQLGNFNYCKDCGADL